MRVYIPNIIIFFFITLKIIIIIIWIFRFLGRVKRTLFLLFTNCDIVRVFLILLVLTEILFAKRASSTIHKPFFNAFIVERMFTIQIRNDVIVRDKFLQTNRTLFIFKLRIVVEMFSSFEEPRCNRILQFILQMKWDMMWWVVEMTGSFKIKFAGWSVPAFLFCLWIFHVFYNYL